jgi:hypothetical protein
VARSTRRRVEAQGVLLPYPHPIYLYLFQNTGIFYSRSKHRKNKKKTISSSRRFSIPRFTPSLCRYDATYRRLGATYLPQENTEEEIVFVEFPSRFSCVLAEKEAWVDDVIGRKCTTPTLSRFAQTRYLIAHAQLRIAHCNIANYMSPAHRVDTLTSPGEEFTALPGLIRRQGGCGLGFYTI